MSPFSALLSAARNLRIKYQTNAGEANNVKDNSKKGN
jgi:hypothetical protein